MPEGDIDSKGGKRYPFLASEILRSGSSIIIEYFFGPEEDFAYRGYISEQPKAKIQLPPEIHLTRLNNYLINFLEDPVSLDPVLSGYYGEILQFFLQRKGPEIRHYYMNQNPRLYDLLVSRIESTSIANVLSKFLLIDNEDGIPLELEGDGATPPIILQTYGKVMELYSKSSNPDIKHGIRIVLLQLAKECSTMKSSKQLEELLFKDNNNFWLTLQEELTKEVCHS